ncbi:MAG: tetratricopeptide repeat protein [Luteolibacter sp.]
MKALPHFLLLVAWMSASQLKADLVSDLSVKATAGDLVSQVELGNLFSKGQGVAKDDKEAIKWYLLAAAQGNLDAQMFLGGIYIRGKSVPKNSAEAAKWYLMAAEQGNAEAQCQVGRMHMVGAGVPKDDAQAYRWSSMAAAQGNMPAKTVLMVLEKRMSEEQIAAAKLLNQDLMELKKLDLPGAGDPPVEPIKPEAVEPDAN